MPTDLNLRLYRYFTEYAHESDRAAGILVGTLLDDALMKLLAGDLVDDPSVSERLFKEQRPLGSFSARIDFAFFRGHLPLVIFRTLHLLRKIRNHCAHQQDAVFTVNPISQWAGELFDADTAAATQRTPGVTHLSIPRIQVFTASFLATALLAVRTQHVKSNRPEIPAGIDEAFGHRSDA